ncbi:MAG TPA: hypothetical protein VNO70_16270 [Blastocatellia bacterium]|nr:hypothetical protein [Blastocatellia bacterium]
MLCEDGIVRPTVSGFVQAADEAWVEVVFLLDAGADRTVFSARFLNRLRHLEKIEAEPLRLAGVGGDVGSITVEAVIGFQKDDGRMATVRGQFGVFTEIESADLPVLGRDVTNNFGVIYDYPNQVVALLSWPHSYVIKTFSRA